MTVAPYLTAAQVRASVPALNNVDQFSDTLINDLVSEFEAVAEDYRGAAFTPRTETETVTFGNGLVPLGGLATVVLKWPLVRTVTSVTADATVVPAASYSVDVRNGTLRWLSVSGASVNIFGVGSVVVVYDHGYTTPPPIVLRACRQYVRACALSDTSGVPRDVIGQSIEGVYTRYSTPDKAAGRPTGWLEVDRLLNSLPDYRAGCA